MVMGCWSRFWRRLGQFGICRDPKADLVRDLRRRPAISDRTQTTIVPCSKKDGFLFEDAEMRLKGSSGMTYHLNIADAQGFIAARLDE
jgi:hypothetical protein